MKDHGLAIRIVAAAIRSTNVPVSAKLRSGYDFDRTKLLALAKSLQEVGLAWLTLHPRTADQKRRGNANWDEITFLRENLSIPVIGNGDVQNVDDVFSMLKKTKCDMVMMGRAFTARPWILWQVGEMLGFLPPESLKVRAPKTREEEGFEYGRMLKRLAQKMSMRENKESALKQFIFFVKIGSPWLEFGHTLFALVSSASDFDQIYRTLDKFFDRPQLMSNSTYLN